MSLVGREGERVVGRRGERSECGEGEETNPMPGVRGVGGRGVGCGSVFRRQERARTPARRMMVPRAIYVSRSASIAGITGARSGTRKRGNVRGEQRVKRAGTSGGNR